METYPFMSLALLNEGEINFKIVLCVYICIMCVG